MKGKKIIIGTREFVVASEPKKSDGAVTVRVTSDKNLPVGVDLLTVNMSAPTLEHLEMLITSKSSRKRK